MTATPNEKVAKQPEGLNAPFLQCRGGGFNNKKYCAVVFVILNYAGLFRLIGIYH
jgi:hypothetical protein